MSSDSSGSISEQKYGRPFEQMNGELSGFTSIKIAYPAGTLFMV